MATSDDDSWEDDMVEEEEESGDEYYEADMEGEDVIAEEGSEKDKNEILTTGQVVEFLFRELKEVQNVIQIPATSVRILLNHFKWDKQRLFERYYTESCPERIFEEAKVLSPSKIEVLAAKTKHSSSPDCEICFLPVPESCKTGLECGHMFCTECWKEYLTTKIGQDGISLSIQCPSGDCQVLVNDAAVLKILGNSEYAKKYQLLITNNLVECNRLMRWCPGTGCGNAVHLNNTSTQEIKCTCGYAYCFACAEDWHGPVGCAMLKKWKKKCEDDSETVNWINANTKECPKCHDAIEKNGGCNHMVCRKQSCKHSFCWICLKPWSTHGNSYYNCSKYEPSENDSKEQSKSWLKKYLFFYERYTAQKQSRKLEGNLYEAMERKGVEIQQLGVNSMDTKFLHRAVDILCECRRTLMYTYVFAFYMKKNCQSEIFGANQRDLESSTETLSEYLEQEISTDNLEDIKMKVLNMSGYCQGRRNALLDHINEGYEKDWWADSEGPGSKRSKKQDDHDGAFQLALSMSRESGMMVIVLAGILYLGRIALNSSVE